MYNIYIKIKVKMEGEFMNNIKTLGIKSNYNSSKRKTNNLLKTLETKMNTSNNKKFKKFITNSIDIINNNKDIIIYRVKKEF